MNRPATAAEVRKLYKDDGYEVRISRDGHVTYRIDYDYHPAPHTHSAAWLDGRWVSEYHVDDESGVYLT